VTEKEVLVKQIEELLSDRCATLQKQLQDVKEREQLLINGIENLMEELRRLKACERERKRVRANG